jgi:calcium-dependent protein kinase
MIDFGLSKHFHVGELQHESVGTPYTVAPEVLMCKDGYDEKVDVWAIGVITYLLLSGDTPFGGACNEDLREVRNRILSGYVAFEEAVWGNVSELAIDFIKFILVVDPSKRPRVEELLKHPWLVTMKRSSSLSDDEAPLDSKVVSGLVGFKEMSNTTKFLCEVLSFTLQPEQLGLLRLEFEKLDSAGKGEINLDGFKTALLERSDEFPLTEMEIEDIFDGLRVRKRDVSIRWHEFIAACLSQCQIDERNIRLAFDRIDSEHKGYVTLEDLKKIMDFYGTDRTDLQLTWITNVLDYKSKKEHMTYDDFYKLLKIDRQFPDSDENLSKSMPPCDNFAQSMPDVNHRILRRHSVNVQRIDSPIVSSLKNYRRLQTVILDASKYAGGNKEVCSRPKKRASLVLRRSAREGEMSLLCKSIDALTFTYADTSFG